MKKLTDTVYIIFRSYQKLLELSFNWFVFLINQDSNYIGGAEEARTPDLFNAIEALSQLSYSPTVWWVGIIHWIRDCISTIDKYKH